MGPGGGWYFLGVFEIPDLFFFLGGGGGGER